MQIAPYLLTIVVLAAFFGKAVAPKADLKMRGSGEIFGTKQSGLPEFHVADIIEDFPILEEARKVASYISSLLDSTANLRNG